MKAVTSVEVKTRQLFECPACGSPEHSYGHLSVGTSFGPWYCDKCGCGVTGAVTAEGVDIKLHTDCLARALVLLRLDVPGIDEKPINIVVKGMTFHEVGEQPGFGNEHMEYFYNEHTCPWNYLRLPIKEGDETDPHGLFVFQEAVLMPADYENHLGGIDEWRELFPSLREGGAA